MVLVIPAIQATQALVHQGILVIVDIVVYQELVVIQVTVVTPVIAE